MDDLMQKEPSGITNRRALFPTSIQVAQLLLDNRKAKPTEEKPS